jgi:SMC domain protein
MYISTLKIKGYRNFVNQTIEFNDGTNMIIGPNNGGKTNILRALRLIFEPHCRFRRMTINDFHRPIDLMELKAHSPQIIITATLKPSKNPSNESEDDLRLIRMWLTKLDDDYEACLSYVFALPASYEDEYHQAMETVADTVSAWNLIEELFLRRYKYYIIGGKPSRMERADSDLLNGFDVQSLEALRNVENDLFGSRSSLLKEVLDFYIDYDIKNDDSLSKEEKDTKQKEVREDFKRNSTTVIQQIIGRLETGKQQMLNYAENTGASFNNAKPDFNGEISEQDLYSALSIIVKYETGVDLPISHNGLGYNNLIYISLLLAKIQADTDIRRMGENAVIYPILIIEEPEAHLHPSMQYKFLSFLKNHQTNKVRQIFVSTHSTQIASAVSLKEIICVQRDKKEKISVAYPYRTFPDNEEGYKSYKYVQRFLDATRCDMLFADKVIFVEGTAEQILLNVLAKYANKSLVDNHVCIVNVGGRYFQHFLKMFDTVNSPFAMNKRVLCLTDIDPMRRIKGQGPFTSCYPFEIGNDEKYEFTQNPFVSTDNEFSQIPNILISSQDPIEGKTFEYDLLLHNPQCKMLITDDMANHDTLIKLMESKTYEEASAIFRTASAWRERVLNALDKSEFPEDKRIVALIASLYLKSIEKGEYALELSNILEDNLENRDIGKPHNDFVVPHYIEEGLKWLLK